MVKSQASILLGEFDAFVWIRCEGKGNFLNSPLLKRAAEAYIEAGHPLVVVDLEACSGMDSTFMGTLAGLAMKLKRSGGALQIARAGEKSIESLSGLGLDMLMDLNPEDAVWRASLEEVEKTLGAYESARLNEQDQAQFCLEAHQILGEANEDNVGRFRAVVEMFEKDLSRYKG